MSFYFLLIGSVFTALFIILLFVGQKYDDMLEPLEGDAYPFKTIYSVGLAMQYLPFARFTDSIVEQLKNSTALYHSKQYSEYYARISLAQILSFGMFFLSLFFVLAGLLNELAILLAPFGIVVSIISGYYFYTYNQNKLSDRKNECEAEFPNAITKLALIVNSGVILHDAWETVATGKDGAIYDLMKKSCEDMRNGVSNVNAIHKFGKLTNSDDIKKFSTALIQNIERGGGELPRFLEAQTTELWAFKRQNSLQKGEKAASALLAPIALMFVGVMLIVLTSAMSSFGM